MPFFGFLSALFNIKKILPFVLQYWRECMVVGMAALIWYQNFNETRWFFGAETIPSLEKRLAGATDAVRICEAGNKTLSATIDKRNEEVKRWKEISDGLEKDIENLQVTISGMRTKTKTEVITILKDPTPQTCEKSIDYLRDSVKDLTW